MKSSSLLKLALFAFICTIISVIGFYFTNIDIIGYAILAFAVICFFSIVLWICTLILGRIRHGLNVVCIFIFLCTSVVLGAITNETIGLYNINNYADLNVPAIAFIASAVACLISVVILVARLVFGKNNVDEINNLEVEIEENTVI